MIIYKITNNINKKIYIGQTTTTLSKRIACYKSNTKNKKNYNQRILMSMIKHGFNNFKIETIDVAKTTEELNAKEIYWISFYGSINVLKGYNVAPGGNFQSKEIIKLRADKLKGKNKSTETKEKIRQSLLGKKHTKERRLKQSTARKNGILNGTILIWNKNTKGIMKANSGSFGNGRIAPNKGRKQIIDSSGKIRYIKHTEMIGS